MITYPIHCVEGIGASEHPLLEFRASVYLISGRERREAGGDHPEKWPESVPEAAGIVH